MVGEIARDILANVPKADPAHVARFTGEKEEDCWDYLIELDITLRQYANERDELEIAQKAKQWAEQLPEAYETKRLLLLERLKNAKTEKEKKERLTHYKVFTNKLIQLPEHQIQRAQDYPIKDLLGTHKNITNCPFHDDKTASLNIKNNFYYCHGCGAHGNSIDFVMQKEGLSFREAVIKLS